MHEKFYSQPVRVIGAGPDEIVLTATCLDCRPGEVCWSEHAPGAAARRTVQRWIEAGNDAHRTHGTGRRLRLDHVVLSSSGVEYLAYVDVVPAAVTS